MTPDADQVGGPERVSSGASANVEERARFVWPPRPLPPDGGSAPTAPTFETNANESPAGGRGRGDACRDGRARAERGAAWTWSSAWREIEATWLGFAAEPLAARLASAGWQPDEPEAYCGRCGQTIERRADGEPACATCREAKQAWPWQRFVRLGEYAPPLDRPIQELKFTAFRALGGELGAMLGLRLRAAVNRAVVAGQLPAGTRMVLVPVPTSLRRRLARGIDHPLVLARAAARSGGAKVWSPLARRHRPPQMSLSATGRAANVKGSMYAGWKERLVRTMGVRPGWGLRTGQGPVLCVLLDDVATTGATLREAARALSGLLRGSDGATNGFYLWAAAVAMTPQRKDG